MRMHVCVCVCVCVCVRVCECECESRGVSVQVKCYLGYPLSSNSHNTKRYSSDIIIQVLVIHSRRLKSYLSPE